MIKATSPAAKVSPIPRDAISAIETSTSALMSKAVTSPIAASNIIGIPHNMMGTHAASKDRGTRSKMLMRSAAPDITSSTMPFFMPPASSNPSTFFIVFCITSAPFYTYGGMSILYI